MAKDVTVRDVMRPVSDTVSWLDTAEIALARMRGLGREQLPVVDAHGVIGLCEMAVLQASA